MAKQPIVDIEKELMHQEQQFKEEMEKKTKELFDEDRKLIESFMSLQSQGFKVQMKADEQPDGCNTPVLKNFFVEYIRPEANFLSLPKNSLLQAAQATQFRTIRNYDPTTFSIEIGPQGGLGLMELSKLIIESEGTSAMEEFQSGISIMVHTQDDYLTDDPSQTIDNVYPVGQSFLMVSNFDTKSSLEMPKTEQKCDTKVKILIQTKEGYKYCIPFNCKETFAKASEKFEYNFYNAQNRGTGDVKKDAAKLADSATAEQMFPTLLILEKILGPQAFKELGCDYKSVIKRFDSSIENFIEGAAQKAREQKKKEALAANNNAIGGEGESSNKQQIYGTKVNIIMNDVEDDTPANAKAKAEIIASAEADAAEKDAKMKSDAIDNSGERDELFVRGGDATGTVVGGTASNVIVSGGGTDGTAESDAAAKEAAMAEAEETEAAMMAEADLKARYLSEGKAFEAGAIDQLNTIATAGVESLPLEELVKAQASFETLIVYFSDFIGIRPELEPLISKMEKLVAEIKREVRKINLLEASGRV